MKREKVSGSEVLLAVGAALWLVFIGAGVASLLCGCATKTRSVEVDGLFTQAELGMMAVGSIDVMATPVGVESALVRYNEDNAWLSPTMKLHEISIHLTGTNAVERAGEIVESICGAFIATAAKTNANVKAVK